MKKTLYKISILILIVLISSGYKTQQPPKIDDKKLAEFLKTLRNKVDIFEVVTTAPNGNYQCRYGQNVVYKNGYDYSLWTCVSSPNGTSWQTVTGGVGSGGYNTIQDEGVALATETILNFIGSSITCADDSGNTRTNCTLTSSGGSPGGNNKDVQFNDSGSFGGNDSFFYDKTNNILSLIANSGGTLTQNGTNSFNFGKIYDSSSFFVNSNKSSLVFGEAQSGGGFNVLVGRSGLTFGDASSNGYFENKGKGSLVGGFTEDNGFIASDFSRGGFVIGFASGVNSDLTSSADGSFANGFVAGGGLIQANNHGSFAGGYSTGEAFGMAINQANGRGSFVYGASINNGNIGANYPSSDTNKYGGNIAFGYASGGIISANGHGSISMGYTNGGNLYSYGNGSIAMGEDVKTIDGNNNSIVFGKKLTNNNANSLEVGFNSSVQTLPVLHVDASNVGIGTSTPHEQLEITKNFWMDNTTATGGIITGVVYKQGTPFIHNYGTGPDDGNTFVGLNAGNFTLTLGSATDNTTMGYKSGPSITDGSDNSFFGYLSGWKNTTGTFNTAIGAGAGGQLTTGQHNTCIGYNAACSVVEFDNTFVGSNAGLNNVSRNNTGLGSNAGSQSTTGEENTYIGYRTASVSTLTGNNNVFLGARAGRITTGSKNTCIGSNSCSTGSVFTVDHSTAIGYGTQITNSNTIILGNGDKVGIGTTNPQSQTDINGGLAVGNYAGVNAAPSTGAIFSGNVGIGISSPSQKLDVEGIIKTNAYVTAPIFYSTTPTTSKALCLNGAHQISTCSSSVDSSGNCTCP